MVAGVNNTEFSEFFGPENLEKFGGVPLQGTFILPPIDSTWKKVRPL